MVKLSGLGDGPLKRGWVSARQRLGFQSASISWVCFRKVQIVLAVTGHDGNIGFGKAVALSAVLASRVACRFGGVQRERETWSVSEGSELRKPKGASGGTVAATLLESNGLSDGQTPVVA
jgi:predicted phage gp36 major capsid-like protein